MSKLDNWRENLKIATKAYGRKRELARSASITPVHLSYLLAGRYDPSAMTLIAIADALGLSVDQTLAMPSDFRRYLDAKEVDAHQN